MAASRRGRSSVDSTLRKSEEDMRKLLLGDAGKDTAEDGRDIDTLIAKVQKSMERSRETRGVGSDPLETANALHIHDPLLDIKVKTRGPEDSSKTIRDVLGNVSTTAVGSIFHQEQDRLNDYSTYRHIYEMIPQVGEAVETYRDNIISPDDWSKRSIECFRDGPRPESFNGIESLRRLFQILQEKYDLDTLIGDSIKHSLYLGDYFTLVLNLKEEITSMLVEGDAADTSPLKKIEEGAEGLEEERPIIESAHCPSSPDMIREVIESFCSEEDRTADLEGDFRNVFTEYMGSFVEVNDDPYNLIKETIEGIRETQRNEVDAPGSKWTMGGMEDAGDRKEGKEPKDIGDIRGSIVRLIDPDYVIKLHSTDGHCFGYFYLEYSENSQKIDFRKLGHSQNNLIHSMDTHLTDLNTGMMGGIQKDTKDRLLTNLFVKTLSSKMKKSSFLLKNPMLARDVYTILRKARINNRRVRVTYIPPSRMVHWTPEGSSHGYGRSVLMRVKFFSKLYIGAMTKAFMRNSIWQTEMLVYNIETGFDNDYENMAQDFMRQIKQKTVQFEDMKDITTVMRNVGHFHNLFFPTRGGERPVQIDTVSLGQAGEVDTPFLDYMRKSIIAGTGVPAAFVGYSEEVSFARTLTMDNGRFLRRVVNHQVYYGRSATQLVRLLWDNEFIALKDHEKTVIKDDGSGKDEDKRDTRKKNRDERQPGKEPIHEAKDEDGKEGNGKIINSSSIIVRLPSPATLNLTNKTELMQQVDNYSEFVSRTLVGETEDAEYKRLFIEQVVIDSMPSIPWERYLQFRERASDARTRPSADKMAEEG